MKRLMTATVLICTPRCCLHWSQSRPMPAPSPLPSLWGRSPKRRLNRRLRLPRSWRSQATRTRESPHQPSISNRRSTPANTTAKIGRREQDYEERLKKLNEGYRSAIQQKRYRSDLRV